MIEKKNNAAIYLISSRTKLLELCLNNLFKNWNNKYNYPVYIHYFNDTDNTFMDTRGSHFHLENTPGNYSTEYFWNSSGALRRKTYVAHGRDTH